jgi:hypothetical protein
MRTKLILLLSVLIISCPSKSNSKTIKIDSNEHWMGVYLNQTKIGYSFAQIQQLKTNYKIVNRIKLDLRMMGQPLEMVSIFSCNVDSAFALQDFNFSLQSKARSFSAYGNYQQNEFIIEIKSAGASKKETLKVNYPIYPVSALGYLMVKQNFQAGREYLVKAFDATVLSPIDAKIKLLGKEKVNISGKEYDLTKITTSYLGVTTTIWVDENGVSWKEESPPGLVSLEETRDQALAQENEKAKLDILSLFSIPIDSLILNPQSVRYLKLQISNIDTSGLDLRDDFQTILQTTPLTLEVKTDNQIPEVILPINEFSQYLSPTLCVQSDNIDIKKQANSIVKKEKNATKIVEEIMKWVYTNVQKRPTASLPSAIDVLKNLEGDCNEHSVLFAALCRAAGIPTQICVGLVYVNSKFYYHAWNKVYLGKWISVDATFGQFPADATHIKFAEGELQEQTKVLNIVGAIKIKILAFQ